MRRILGCGDVDHYGLWTSDSDQECGGYHSGDVSIAILGFRLQPQPHFWDQHNMLGWTHPMEMNSIFAWRAGEWWDALRFGSDSWHRCVSSSSG